LALSCGGGTGEGSDASNTALTTTTIQRTTTTLAPATWEAVVPAGESPAGRLGGSLVYLPAGGKCVLFGGWAGGTDYSDSIWSYDSAANTWSELNPAGARPAARASQSMAYDPSGNRLIVFGGFSGTSYHDDTWAYDLATNTWAALHPLGDVPAARGGHSLAYDPDSKKMILFGGYDGSAQYNDTWAYDPATNAWANLRPSGKAPAAREGQAMAYHPQGKVMVLFGGWSTTKQFADTWAYTPSTNTWALLAPAGDAPSARALHQMVYDPTVKKMVLFGGGTSSATFNDVWNYDLDDNSWAKIAVTGDQPTARAGHCLVYDSAGKELVLFGGSNGVNTYYNDLWVLRRGKAAAPTTTSSSSSSSSTSLVGTSSTTTSLEGTSSTTPVSETTEP
jgi:N-acetylneuraminic acid mutarotase